MKKINIYPILFFLLIMGFVVFDFSSNKTIAHHEDLSSSSSSSGQITLNKNFKGAWKARVTKPVIMSSFGSSSGSGECVICIQVIPQCLPDQKLVSQTCTECAHCTNSGGSTASTTSGQVVFRETSAHINSGFSGSRIITFKLCVKNGKLEGTIQQTGVIEKGVIISQKIISKNEVDVTFKDKKDVAANVTLKLVGRRKFTGTFVDNHVFEAKKINSFKSCLVKNK